MKHLRKMLTVACIACVMLLLASCGKEDKKLVIWSFTDELEVQGDIQYFEDNYTGKGQKWEGYEVELAMVPTDDYLTKLLPVLESGKGAPDLFTGELDMVQNFMEAGYIADLESLINTYGDEEMSMDVVNNDFIDYIVQSGRDAEGKLRALSWQVTPGGIMYRTDLAVLIWGDEMTADGVDTTSTTAISEWMGANKFNSLEQLEISSQEAIDAGNYRLFTDDQAIRHYATGKEPSTWVVDGKINPEKIEDHIVYMETRKEFYGETFAESLTANAAEWGAEWYSAVSGPIQPVGEEESYEVMAYSLPTWGLFHVIEPNMQVKDADGNVTGDGTYGKWGISPGPNSYYWGGTYLVINENKEDEKKEIALDFMKSMLFDEERMTERAIDNGDVYARKSVMDTVQEQFTGRESIGDQNHYEFFMAEADKIDLSYVTKYDRALNNMLGVYTEQYAKGELTMEEALNNFYSEVTTTYGEEMISGELPYKQ